MKKNVRRLVLDPGVFVSALITPAGVPGQLLEKVYAGEFETAVSPLLLRELEKVLGREKFRRYLDLEAVDRSIDRLRRAFLVPDPEAPPPFRCADPKDDYLLALAFHEKAIIVSGDKHLLELGRGAPIVAPADLVGQPA